MRVPFHECHGDGHDANSDEEEGKVKSIEPLPCPLHTVCRHHTCACFRFAKRILLDGLFHMAQEGYALHRVFLRVFHICHQSIDGVIIV